MTFYPVLPPLLLAIVAAVVVAARAATLRRILGGREGRTRTALWRWSAVTAAALLLMVAATRPVIGPDEGTTPGAADAEPNVFLVVDRSPGMGVEDLGGGRSRMDAAKADVAAVLERYPLARFSVIAFASGPSQDWPLSADTWSLGPVLAAMAPYAAGPEEAYRTNVAAADVVLRYQLIAARIQFPRAQNLVYYLGAGAGETRTPPREFDLVEGSVDGGAVLGYGTAAGGVIPRSSVSSTIDEPALRGVAEQLGVPYLPRAGAGPLPSAMFDDAPYADGSLPSADPSVGPTETYWIAALAAAALILLELYLALRASRRTRSTSTDVVS